MKYNNTTAAIICSAFVALNGQEVAASAPDFVHKGASQSGYREYCGQDFQNFRTHATTFGKTAVQAVKSYAALSRDLNVPTMVCSALLVFNSANKTDATLAVLQMTAALPLTQVQTEKTQALQEKLGTVKREGAQNGTKGIQEKLETAGLVINALEAFTPSETTASTANNEEKETVSTAKNKENELKISEKDQEATEKLSRIAKNAADLATSTVKTCKEAVQTAYDAVKIAAKSIHWTCCHLKNKIVQLLSGKKVSEEKAAEQQPKADA